MSKSRGNVVTPDSVIERYGADVTRLYILFIAPFEASAVWEVEEDGTTPQHIEGVRRFHERVWRLVQPGQEGPAAGAADEALRRAMHRVIRDVTAEIEAMRYNTAISALMTFSTALEDYRGQHGDTVCFYEARRALVLLLAPLAPFITEEAWRIWGEAGSVHHQRWPEYDPELSRPAEVTIPVQVDGRVRDRITVPAEADEETVRAAALAAEAVQRTLDGRRVQQVIVVPGRLVNVVTGADNE
jgi:leucyl-tRNA synthetase